MAEKSIKQQAEEFAALPRSERKATFASLPDAVRPLARELVTLKYRGFRHVNGRLEFSQAGLAEQIAHLKQKEVDLAERKIKVGERKQELQEEYAERFGALPEELE